MNRENPGKLFEIWSASICKEPYCIEHQPTIFEEDPAINYIKI
jgi:hypothetical protein